MSTTAADLSTTAANPSALENAWLFGRGTDLLIGCGLAYLLFIPVLLLVSGATGVSDWPPFLVIALGLLTSTPHYGATLLRVYQTQEDRRKYALFASWITIGLVLLLVIAARNVWLASLLITVYFTWSPWHFSGQNYGLSLVFLRKRGVEVDPTTKRLIHVSFVLSAALAILAIHGGQQGGILSPDVLPVANTPRMFTFPLPPQVAVVVIPLVLLGYLGSLGAAAWRLGSRARLRTLAPALLLVISQALWFVVPLLIAADAAGGWNLIFASVWFSSAHAAQYLWVTAYYEKSSGRSSSVGNFLWKSLLAGTALSILPAFVLAPDLLGGLPIDAGLAAVIFATLNIHHFILDGAIWKLRDGRVARILLRAPDPATSPAPASVQPPVGRPWLRGLVWGIAGACLVAQLMNYYATALVAQAKDSSGVLSAARINRWIGRETVGIQLEIGRRLAAEGDRSGAIEHLRRSIELFPSSDAWVALGSQYRAEGQEQLALAAFDSAIQVDSRDWAAHYERAVTLLADAANGEPNRREAIHSLERALELRPGHPGATQLLARARRQGTL